MTLKKVASRYAVIGAFLMSLSCTCKITAFYLGVPIISQWINIILNAIIVYGCYVLGKKTGAPKAQTILCGVAMLGYIMYSLILLYAPNQQNFVLSEIVFLFFILTLCASVACLVVLIMKDIKKDEETLKKFEEYISKE